MTSWPTGLGKRDSCCCFPTPDQGRQSKPNMGSKDGHKSNSNDHRNCYATYEKELKKASVREGKKPFKCENCDYSCSLKVKLNQHVASVHEGKQPFKCESYDLNCDQNNELQQNVASDHEEKKPFKCEYCDYTCVKKGNLSQHITLVHEGKKREPLNIVTLNVCGLKSYGRIDQVRSLLLKYKISVAF